MASHLPSGESPWLPVQFVAAPVLRIVAVPPSAGIVQICPSRLKIRVLLSRLQFGAYILPCTVATTMARRKLSSMPIVCNVLYTVCEAESG